MAFVSTRLFSSQKKTEQATETEKKLDEKTRKFVEEKVKPLFSSRCYKCHGPKAKKLKGELRLDSRSAMLKGGESGAAIVPGKPGESLLIEAIKYEGLEMPPRTRLPKGEVEILVKWIEMGAPWTKETKISTKITTGFPLEERKKSHWAWKLITNPTPPTVRHKDWPQSDIDRFILAKLEAKGLSPAKPADRRTLIRRAYFDVVGLPPSVEDVERFANDPLPTPAAFEKVVDKLLASPRFGERWARHWLDLVRYAETAGHEFDYPLHHAYEYRDYVIRALNADVPYDQFVLEHIAGDLLENPRRHPTEGYNESIIGTGFWFLGEGKHAPVDVRGDEASRWNNQIDVFSKTFLGLTVACARCHDHKFDAISSQDYYALAGFLKSSRQQVALLDPHKKIANTRGQLVRLQRQGSELILNRLAEQNERSISKLQKYLLAARETMYGTPTQNDQQAEDFPQTDILFEDFELGTFDKWKIDGTAFGNQPETKQTAQKRRISGFSGNRFAMSLHPNDKPQGMLTSEVFTIERDLIRFQIAGGAHKFQTCFNLKVAGKVVRSATGKNREQFETQEWDVSEFRGKKAVLEIVDRFSKGWGHIHLDQIVFSDRPEGCRQNRSISVVAKEAGLDARQLRNWVRALGNPEIESRSHLLAVWNRLAKTRDHKAFIHEKTNLREMSERRNKEYQKFVKQTELFEDFNPANFKGWFRTGYAFPTQPAVSEWNPKNETKPLLARGILHSGLYSNKLQGVYRSPTFILNHDHILYRIAGSKTQVRLIIDGFIFDEFNALLFNGARFNVNSPDGFRWYVQGSDISRYQGHRAHIEIKDEGDGWIAIDEIRFANRGIRPIDPAEKLSEHILRNEEIDSFEKFSQATAEDFVNSLTDDSRSNAPTRLVNWFLSHHLLGDSILTDSLDKLKSEIARLEVQIPTPKKVRAIAEGTAEDEHLFIRGGHNNLGEVVPRRFLTAIAGKNQPAIQHDCGRLELAQRLLAQNDPFPARVMVNRIWHHLFGRGIVETIDNFGVLGQPPTHPKLLDYLANRFRNEGWSTKKTIRSIILSSTYQMASTKSKEAAKIDPQNLWLHRSPIRRLQGEAIRDAMLAVSGRLDTKMFGPSIPVYLTSHMQGRGRPQGGPLDGAGRRSLYTKINRNFLSPMMLAFDTPIPFSTVGKRNVSNVPAQALILMNDPFVIEQAKLWANRVLQSDARSPQARIKTMYEATFSRPPSKKEQTEATSFLKLQAAEYNLKNDAWKNDPQVWTDFCHVLFNVKEFIYIQ